jgi:hypothetical protein
MIIHEDWYGLNTDQIVFIGSLKIIISLPNRVVFLFHPNPENGELESIFKVMTKLTENKEIKVIFGLF